jgi:CRISPR-associated protein Csb1
MEEKHMSEPEKKSPPKKLTPADVLKGESPLVLTATLEPIGSDRFQPAGFPEIGHVIYKAPRKDRTTEPVCIVDSAASMANHLEAVCMRGRHDFDLVDELDEMPYIRCVTGDLVDGKLPIDKRETVVTSLTEGHRIASSLLLEGKALTSDGTKSDVKFEDELIKRFDIVVPNSPKAHPSPEKWWDVFKNIFELDPNSLVHGVLFPQWQIKIPRALTAHLEAFGAGRVDRSGVKFDKELGPKSDKRVQAIFAVDDAVAESIRATFVLDVGLIRSFGRKKGDKTLGLSEKQQEFLVALALWKIQRLLASPYRFRSGCHLRCTALVSYELEVELDVDIGAAIKAAGFGPQPITDVFWPREELYREGKAEAAKGAEEDDETEDSEE